MNRNILLVEPNYKNKYPPMGLMKIAMYHRLQGDNVVFWKGEFHDFILRELTEALIQKLFDIDNSVENDAPDYSSTRRKNKINWLVHKPELITAVKTGRILPDSGLELATEKSPFSKLWILDFHKQYSTNAYCNTPKWDRICITTLFTFYWDLTIKTINNFKKLCKNPKEVHVGGILASLVPDLLERDTGIKPHIGIISEPIYPGDTPLKPPFNQTPIDELPLDYSLIEETDYEYPEINAYFGYTTRGCINKCEFCAVPKLEPNYINHIPLVNRIHETIKRFGEQKNLLLLDNNVFASESFNEIIDEIASLGFANGATYIPPNQLEIAIKLLLEGWNDRAYIKMGVRLLNEFLTKLKGDKSYEQVYSLLLENNLLHDYSATKESILQVYDIIKDLYEQKRSKRPVVRFVDFNQGLDARKATHEIMKKMSTIAIRPMRIAFDWWALRLQYVKAIILAQKNNILQLSNYLLYNFKDKPIELYYRLLLNVELCEELGVNIYSFPMKYHPIFEEKWLTNRDYIGENWSRKEIRCIQAVLNSTHGKIGKGRTFFYKAFGRNAEEFKELLILPEAFIIKRWDAEITGLKAKWLDAYNNLSSDLKEIFYKIVYSNDFSPSTLKEAPTELSYILTFYQYQREDIPTVSEEAKNKAITTFEASCPEEVSSECKEIIEKASKSLEEDYKKKNSNDLVPKRKRGRPPKNKI